MRAFVPAVIACFALLACDTQNSAKLNVEPSSRLGDFAFDDPSAGGAISQESLIQFQTTVIGTSADGAMADLLVSYTLDPYVLSLLTPDSYVQFDIVVSDAQAVVVSKVNINGELSGEVQLTVPTDDDSAKLVATIGGLLDDVVDSSGILAAQVPAVGLRETTDLSLVQGLRAELIEGSYESNVANGRRVHEFAVRVIDPTAGPISDLLNGLENSADIAYSITGLEKDAALHFSALENGLEDIESPVTVSFTEHPLAVYLVIDTSKSVVESGQAHHLLNAVSNSVIALSKNAEFDYRVFNGEVSRLKDLRQLDFDSGDSSATALYYAIDTALSDIEDFGSIEQDKIVMVFTDGKDLASRNHYGNDFIDNTQVHEYVIQRVEQVRRTQSESLGRQLQVYTVGFYDEASGLNAPEEVAKLDAISQAGGTGKSYNNFNAEDIQSAFAEVVHNVKGVYYLQYSSQQTADDNSLELVVQVNGHRTSVTLPNQD